ncbi:4-hydroxy-3-methylbut-2-enyl diphosphate reductase [Rickettsiales bacterium]|nr:4-hydroxy-3-methylbut-2-enyl diphosphate reductase [Rickettsiales bacterium]
MSIKILLASPRGFCAGVQRAIDIVEAAIKHYGLPLYVKHQIVHNIKVIKYFEDKGVIFVEDVQDIPDGSNVIFSAHGSANISFDIASEKKLNVIDAVCPLVESVHSHAKSLERKGCEIILIGKRTHIEVIGTVGKVDSDIIIIENEDDARSIEVKSPDKVGYITQTTLNVDETMPIINVLKSRFPKIIGPHHGNICYATKNRQDVISTIAPQCDVVFIVGSQNSSNSKRLREVGEISGCSKVYLLNSREDIEEEYLNGAKVIGISAGASAPEHLVQGIIQYIKDNFNDIEIEEVFGAVENITFKMPQFK